MTAREDHAEKILRYSRAVIVKSLYNKVRRRKTGNKSQLYLLTWHHTSSGVLARCVLWISRCVDCGRLADWLAGLRSV